MSSPLPAHAVASAFKLSAADRYTLFLSEVTAHAQVWTLKGADGFVAFKDDDGHECFPFWPAAEFATALVDRDWADCRAEPLALEIFKERWLKGMARDQRQVAVFPAPDGTSIVLEPLTVLEDLIEEAQQ
ncbi:hypothetical protein CKO12_06055 [Chromatium okenii]|uniref:DUF2750 domain-containing protein n=1 Tax=Chromatium okenii TaxID=61644 RepID=UPI001902DF38|nr:DUF2750 domain-containing protein [Chromatium okenii]MBK1641443.1 hypothetical protein [Chromatium okenii]